MFNPNLRGGTTKDSRTTKDSQHGGMFGLRDLWPSGVYVRDLCNRGDQVRASFSAVHSLAHLGDVIGNDVASH